MMIKLGMVLHNIELHETTTKAGYRPRLVRKVFVVCKVHKPKGSYITKVMISDGVVVKSIGVYGNDLIKLIRPGEFARGYFKSERYALKALVERKCPYDLNDDPEWVDEWKKEQGVVKRAIGKLKGGKK
ncbi:hypothetical protein S144_69 [Shewanella sp. phage 1/44]|uniref:hypothetical protein n=1 Tax=Shewanella sp. phage 1/44 TaxID=1458862 RepID=UPI0004F5C242|nr:hypothetical protein S144_69 [Shewanella sp. phage 1/44]AHK11783.1 hypothetical protein S144_69 [Shewanella sp. phage 1/44]